MASPPGRDESIAELLVDLGNAAVVPAKQRAVKISNVVEQICSQAYEEGLSNTSLDKLVDIITQPNELDQGSLGSLMRNLYPASKVPESIVVKVIGSLGHGRNKPSYATQAALLKWVVMIYEVLENQTVLSRLYSVLFNLLDTIATRPQLCHVLSLITRRRHVRPFRIQALMELTRQAGNDPPLVGLMRVFKDYYPDVIVGDVTSGRASVFTHPNQEWRQRLGEIQETYLQRTQDTLLPKQRAFRVTRRRATGRKSAFSSVIPEVRTSHAQESSITLEEIENVDDFVGKLERIELPNQIVAVIGDPLLRKFLLLKSSDSTARRIDSWLLAFFEDQLETQEPRESSILAMLDAIQDYARYTKRLPPACLAYLQSMMPSWNGSTGRETILDLLSYTPIGSFEALYQSVFQPLEEAVLEDRTNESKLALLTFYNTVLRRWTTFLISQAETYQEAGPAIESLINHANHLALTIVQTSLDVTTCSAVLTLYETIASLISQPELRTIARITTPPAELIYTLYFSLSLCTVSRLCSILTLYKRAFELAMSPKISAFESQSYPKEYVNHFNGFLMDICNCIWRGRAFNATDMNAMGCLMPAQTVAALGKYVSSLDSSMSLSTLFSLSFSPVFCQAAIAYVREREDQEEQSIEIRHAGPVTQTSLKQLERDGGLKLSWADYRLGVLRHLENEGVPGVGELMYNTMKHLMTARENMA